VQALYILVVGKIPPSPPKTAALPDVISIGRTAKRKTQNLNMEGELLCQTLNVIKP